ncbi:MAG: hypothetical protein ACREIT_09170, partial [Tepidisphaeraceae bacterium]
SWADTLVLGQCFRFPPEYRAKPRLITLGLGFDWNAGFDWDAARGRFVWASGTTNPLARTGDVLPPSDNVILLRVKDFELVRVESPVEIDGHLLHPKPSEPGARLRFRKRPLYDYLIGEKPTWHRR